MTTEEHHKFCDALAEVMKKHGVAGLAGYWFGKPGKGSGVVTLCGSLEFELKELIAALKEDMREKMELVNPRVSPVSTKGTHLNKEEKN